MPDPRQNVRPGQKLQIAAEQINFLNRMMRQAGGFGSGGLAGWPAGTNVIYGKNVGSATVEQGYAQAITGIVIDPTYNQTSQRQFWDMPCIEFDLLEVPEPLSGQPVTQPIRICVPLEPIAPDKIGRVIVSGVAQVRWGGVGGYTVVKEPTRPAGPPPFATPQSGGTFRGTYNSSAAARVVWAPDDDVGFAVVQLCESGNRLHFGKSPDGSWPPNQSQGVELYDDGPDGDVTGSLSSVANTLFHPIAADSWVVVWSAPDGRWYVVSAGKWDYEAPQPIVAGHDLMQLDTYDPNTTQLLGHEDGELKWFSTTECPPS